ncbi:hypothetical protein TorRG33x02_100680, partial [Trema orientale]
MSPVRVATTAVSPATIRVPSLTIRASPLIVIEVPSSNIRVPSTIRVPPSTVRVPIRVLPSNVREPVTVILSVCCAVQIVVAAKTRDRRNINLELIFIIFTCYLLIRVVLLYVCYRWSELS